MHPLDGELLLLTAREVAAAAAEHLGQHRRDIETRMVKPCPPVDGSQPHMLIPPSRSTRDLRMSATTW
jgi:hypothetical protein